MPSDHYATIRIYLHKEEDKKLLDHLRGLPRYLRQAYMRESLQRGMEKDAEPKADQAKKKAPQGFRTFGSEG
jgi:hypothetical protein